MIFLSLVLGQDLRSAAHLKKSLFLDMQVNLSLTAARARLNKMKEERDQFGEASNQIVTHFKSKVFYCNQNIVLIGNELQYFNR